MASSVDSKHYLRVSAWAHGFPEELWSSEVVPKLDPVDVLSLGQTCQALRSILSCLSIWRRILVAVCDAHGLFLPSYPIEKMGIEELQLASLRPHRWKRLVQKNAVLVQEIDDAVPLLAKVSSDEMWPNWMAIYLVPGGRFLAMINSDGSRNERRLEMWDLGLPGQRPQPQPILLANTEVYAHSESYDLVVCPYGNSLRVATSYMLEDQSQLFSVFSIIPSERTPKFVERVSLRLTTAGEVQQHFELVDDRALFIQSDLSCILCDFGTSLFVRWNFESASTEVTDPQRSFLTRDHVFILGNEEALVWKISSLGSRSLPMPADLEFQTANMFLQNIAPDLTVEFPGQQIKETSERFAVHFTPLMGSIPSLTVDIFEERLSCLHFSRYTIADSDGAPQAPLVSTGYFPANSFTRSAFLSGDAAHVELEREIPLRTFLYDGGGSPQDQSEPRSAMGSMVTALEPDMILWASCVASGRFIYNKYDTSMRQPPTYIVDYL